MSEAAHKIMQDKYIFIHRKCILAQGREIEKSYMVLWFLAYIRRAYLRCLLRNIYYDSVCFVY